MKKKILMIVSLCATFVCALTACNGKGGGGGKIPAAVDPVSDSSVHTVEGTLHRVNVDFGNAVGDFVKDGASAYKVFADGSATGEAAGFLKKQVLAATGVMLETEDGLDSVSRDGAKIILGSEKLFEEAGFRMSDYGEIGFSGYTVQTYGKTVFIMANSARGYQLASIAFLRAVLGYDMIAGDLVVFEKDGKTMPAMNIVERPDIEYSQNNNTITGEAIYGMGFCTTNVYINTGFNWMHNIQDFTTAEQKAAHPLWFTVGQGVKGKEQACFTAHGDKEEYELMVEAYADSVFSFMQKNPTINNIVISLKDQTAGDEAGYSDVRSCKCDACKASYEHYGETIAGAMLPFVNDVAETVDGYIEAGKNGVSPDKEFNIVLLAYQDTLRAPTKKDSSNNTMYDEKGRGIPADEYRYYVEENKVVEELQKNEDGSAKKLVCHDRVGVLYAASSANYLYSFYDDANSYYSDLIQAWAGITKMMYFWTYEINYYNYLYPFNSYDSLAENMRYLKECGAKCVYSEGTWENPNNSGFTKLRDYIYSRIIFDVNLNYGDLVNRFFKYYFDDAEPMMRRFFDEVQINLRAMEGRTGTSVHSDDLARADVWPEGTIRGYMDLIDEAYAAIGHYRTADPDKYAVLEKHILIESIFPRFVLCTTYASSFNSIELNEMRLAFKEDFTKLKNTTHKEHTTIQDVYTLWGV